MAEVKLPRLGQGMESGTIVRWLKSEGDIVEKGEPLYELDTEKVTQEVEAELAGVLREILVREGEVDVGTAIAVIDDAGAEAPEEDAGDEAELDAAPEPAEDRSPASRENGEKGQGEQGDTSGEPHDQERGEGREALAEEARPGDDEKPVSERSAARVKASPLARRIARQRGVDLGSVEGTGPDGRVVAEDVERAGARVPAPRSRDEAPEEVEVVQLTSTRKTIARRLTEAWTAPVFQLGVSADMTEAFHLREALVARLAEDDVKPTVNDLLTKLVAVALAEHPALNATFAENEIRRHRAANVGIAVAAPAGLVVPVVQDAGRLTVSEIARVRADLVTRARDGKLTRDDLDHGTFTISNLGMFGVEQFVAVLNPPQVAILAVGAVKDTAVVVEGELDVAPVVQLMLTCDHRAIDGAEGADFLRTLVALIEQPGLAL